MPEVLSKTEIRQYREEGYCFPVSVLSATEVAERRAQLERFESGQGQPVQGPQRSKSHLLFKWGGDLMRAQKIVDVAEDLIGPYTLCWNSIF